MAENRFIVYYQTLGPFDIRLLGEIDLSPDSTRLDLESIKSLNALIIYFRRIILNSYSRTEHRGKKRKEVFKKLNEDFTLPSPSKTVMEVIRLCRSDTSSLNEIAERIQTDPALSAEIIKYANSAFLSTGIQVVSVHKATVKLGMKTVVNLALGFSLLSSNKAGACENFDYPRFWRTSLAEALAARELARRDRDFDPDELFVCALLAHMGNLSFATLFPEDYGRMLENQPVNSPAKDLELEKFGIDSSELTVELFLNWGLPARYALAAGFHEDLGYVELGTGTTRRAAVLLFLAHTIAQMCQSDKAQPELLNRVLDTAKEYAVDLGDFCETFAAIVGSWHEHGRLFEIATSECYTYSSGDH